MNKLTLRHQLFCLELFKNGGKKMEAAIKAGYSPRSASSIASILLSKPLIQQKMDELKQKAEEASVMNVLERKQRLSQIGRANITDFIDAKGNITFDAENKGALAELVVDEIKGNDDSLFVSQKKRLKLHSPIQAIEELNKMDKVYDTSTNINIDNRQIHIIVRSEETKKRLENIGERLLKLNDGKR